jgi:GxxExxY protein
MSSTAELYQQQGYDLMGAAFEVYNEMGHGFFEEVYHEGLEMELTSRAIPFVSKTVLPLFYKGRPMTKYYQVDLIIVGEIVVELKAVRALVAEHDAQLINYLKATRKRVGYLINFGSFPKLEWKRLVL